MTEITSACAKATTRYPQGRTGTAAGYAAHRSANEEPCPACTAAHSARCYARAQSLAPEDAERRKEQREASGRRRRTAQREKTRLADACVDGLRGTAEGYEAHIAAGQRPCPPCSQSPTIPGLACSRPTLKYPSGRTGIAAGYQAHRDADETACRACMDAKTGQITARRSALSEEEKAQFRRENLEAHRQWKVRNPEAVRATKHRAIAKNRALVRAAKDKPCADCGVRYPYYVMEFDHLDSDAKHFNISAGVTRASIERLKAEIAKCEVVCANCHCERTHRRRIEKGVRADALD